MQADFTVAHWNELNRAYSRDRNARLEAYLKNKEILDATLAKWARHILAKPPKFQPDFLYFLEEECENESAIIRREKAAVRAHASRGGRARCPDRLQVLI